MVASASPNPIFNAFNRTRRFNMRIFLGILLSMAVSTGALAQAASPAVAPSPATQSATMPTDNPDYILGSGDAIQIAVFGVPELGGAFTVSGAGIVSLPLVGDIKASGLTVAQLTDVIGQKLKDGYVLDPKISMQVTSFRPYYILGEVNKPDQYAYADGLNVLNAVARAGGFTYRAQEKHVFIKHAGERKETEDLLTTDLMVAPGDTIRVAERHW
jgi:polysaccharide export outer membrane protein